MSGGMNEEEQEARAAIARVDALSTHHDPVHGGVRVRWRRFGSDTSRPPLVLLHGGHGSWMHWLRNAEALSAGRTLWLPDMPGFNESDAPPRVAPGEDSLPPLLDALGGTLDQLIGPGTPIDLGGFSFGGLTAARFAVRRGAIRRLALVGSGGHGTRFRSKEVSLSGGLQQAIDTLGVPTLLLWGEFDVTADPRPLVARLVAEGPGREGAVIDGAGHWAQYERADEVNARLLQFLA